MKMYANRAYVEFSEGEKVKEQGTAKRGTLDVNKT